MKIVFWSPVHGQTKQSSNMLAVSLMLAMKYKYRILITQTQYRMNDFEDAVVGRTGAKEIREQFYQDMGIDAVSRCIKHKRLEKNDLENCCVQLLETPELMLLPGSRSGNYQVHCEALGEIMPYLINEAEKYFDYVLIDSNPGQEYISNKLLKSADIVVINLSQNIGVIDAFFQDYPKELEGKTVYYLFGAYIADSCYNIHNLKFRYGKIKRSNSGTIPLNVGYMDAVSSGKTTSYFEMNIECEPEDANYFFMKEVDAAVEHLLHIARGVRTEQRGKEAE